MRVLRADPLLDCQLEVLGIDFFCREHGALRVCHYVSFTGR